MLIDWFTVIAQAGNFLILVWLLKRFLYKPVLAAIGAREAKIAATLKSADVKKAEAQLERDNFKEKNDAAEAQRAALLHKATEEANAERQRLLDAARRDAAALRAKLDAALKSERAEVNREIVNRIQQEVFALTRQALADLADASLEDRIVDVFVLRLRQIGTEERAVLLPAKPGVSSACVTSAFDLAEPKRAAIETAIKERLGAQIQIIFTTEPGLVSGIELSTDGRKITWSIAHYMASLSENVTTLLAQIPGAPTAPPSRADAAHAA
jgi:F-type H+-transporting ATPase subunit b